MTLVPMEFRRPMGFEGPLDFRGPMEMTLTNQFVEHRGPFFWGGSHQNPKKIVAFSSSFLKFKKLRCPIFELTLGLSLTLGAPTNN